MLRLLFLLLITLVSCGPNAEEKANLIKAQEVLIRDAKIQKQQFENQINNFNAELVVQNDKLSQIQEFHFLRTSEEREQQIRDQVLKINEINDIINELIEKKNAIDNRILNLEIELTKYTSN